MARVLAYNLAESDEEIKFDYNFQNSHENIENESELQNLIILIE